MSERWVRYLEEAIAARGGLVAYAAEQWAYLAPVIEAIRAVVPPGGKVLDVGCGAGTLATLLAHLGYEVIAVDQDPAIVALAERTARYFHAKLTLGVVDAADLSAYRDRADLACSLGVLEHFPPEKTVACLREQARVGPLVLVVVPSRHTVHAAPVTDERLYTLGALCHLVRRAGLTVRRRFVFGTVPTLTYRNLERALPAAFFRSLQRRASYAMSLACLGARTVRGGAS